MDVFEVYSTIISRNYGKGTEQDQEVADRLCIRERLADRKGMEGKMRDVFAVFCTVISRNYSRGTEEGDEASQASLGTSSHRTGKILNMRQK